MHATIACLIVASACSACFAQAREPVPGPGAPKGTEAPPPRDPGGFALMSSAFSDGERIPDEFTVDGADVSPPLSWTNAPAATKSFALICEDPDAGRKPWVHWVIYSIPGDVKELPRGLKRERDLKTPVVALQGSCSWPKDNIGYRGPATPRGHDPHRYRFTLYALKASPDLPSGLPAETLRDRIKSLVIAEARLTGTFSRPRRAGELPPGVKAPSEPTVPSTPEVPGAPAVPPAPSVPPTPPTPPAAPPSVPPARTP